MNETITLKFKVLLFCIFSYQIHLNTKGLPAKCMVLTRNQTELWIGSGNMIVIVDPNTYAIIDHIEAAKPNRQALAITSDGVNYVWNCERSMSFIVQWDVETRSKMCEYQCNIERPLDQTLHGKVGSLPRNSTYFSSLEKSASEDDSVFSEPPKIEKPPGRTDQVSFEEDHFRDRAKSVQTDDKNIFFKLIRTKTGAAKSNVPLDKVDIEVKPRSKSDETNLPGLSHSPTKSVLKPLSAVEEQVPENIISGKASVMHRTIRKKPSLMFPSHSGKGRKSKRDKDYIPSELVDNSLPRPRSGVVKGTPIRVTSLKYVEGALWVGRTSGDILIISVGSDSDSIANSSNGQEAEGEQSTKSCGKVVAVLGDDKIRPLGGFNRTVNTMVEYEPGMVLALVRFDTKPPSKSPKVSQRHSIPSLSALSPSSKIPENFQILKFKAWSPSKILKFRENVSYNE